MDTYRVLLDGVPIECESLEAAKKLARSIASDMQDNGHRRERPAAVERRDRFRKDALRLLKAVRDAIPHGTTGEKLAQLLSLKKVKGLGPIAAALHKRLSEKGIDPRMVLDRVRVEGERRWIAKEKIEDAIKALGG